MDDHVGKTKYLPLGIRNFFNFLEKQHYLEGLNGFSFNIWRKHLPTKSEKKRGEKTYVDDEDITEAYELIKEKWKDETTETLFKLLVFSGIRLEHAYRLLQNFNSNLLVVRNKVAYYPMDALMEGKRKPTSP